MANINILKTGGYTTGVYIPSIPAVGSPLPAVVATYFPYTLQTGEFPRRKIRVGLSDLTALGAFTTGDIIIHINQPGTIINWTLVKPQIALTDAVGGTGSNVALSAATARIVTVPLNSVAGASATHSFGTAYDVFQTVGATVLDYDGTHPNIEAQAAQSWTILRLTTTGANFSALTNGQIDVWFDYQIVSV